MTKLEKISPQEVASRLAEGSIVLIDIREADEFARERIQGAVSAPLSALSPATFQHKDGPTPVFMCRTGNRTDVNCAQLAASADGAGLLLDGGLEAWRASGLPTAVNKGAPLELMRQVQIAAGSLVLIGVLMGSMVHPGFFGLSAFVGAGLTFAGVSGWCGMARLLSVMPWNRAAAA